MVIKDDYWKVIDSINKIGHSIKCEKTSCKNETQSIPICSSVSLNHVVYSKRMANSQSLMNR